MSSSIFNAKSGEGLPSRGQSNELRRWNLFSLQNPFVLSVSTVEKRSLFVDTKEGHFLGVCNTSVSSSPHWVGPKPSREDTKGDNLNARVDGEAESNGGF
jgi:hypothetical protein